MHRCRSILNASEIPTYHHGSLEHKQDEDAEGFMVTLNKSLHHEAQADRKNQSSVVKLCYLSTSSVSSSQLYKATSTMHQQAINRLLEMAGCFQSEQLQHIENKLAGSLPGWPGYQPPSEQTALRCH